MSKKTEKAESKHNNLVLIYGNQYYVDGAINQIKKQIKCNEIIKLDGESLSVEQIINSICSEDMFSNRKIFMVYGAPKDGANDLIKHFPSIPSSNFIIFYYYSSMAAKKKFCQYFSDNAKLLEYNVDVKDIDKMAKKIIESYNKEISENALHLICEYMSGNIGVLDSEIKKLCNYIGDKKNIEEEDIINICCLSKEFIIWDMIKSISEKNIQKAMSLLSSAKEDGASYEFIILMLMRAIKLGIFLTDGKNDGIGLTELIEKIKLVKKNDGNSVYNDYEIRKTYDSKNGFFGKFSILELIYCLNNCHESFLNVRKLYKVEDQEKEMSMLLFSICYPSCFSKVP